MLKTPWKKLLRDAIILVIIAGIFVGFYFASLRGPSREFSWGFFFVFVFLLIVVGSWAIYIYWSIKRKRERRSPKAIRTVQAMRKNDLISEEEHLLQKNIKPLLNKLGVVSLKNSEDMIPRVSFKFQKDHTYNFLYNLSIEVLSTDDIRFSAILRTEYPVSLSIKKRHKEEKIPKEENEIESSKYFIFHSSHHVSYEEIFSKKKFDELLYEMRADLVLLTFNGKFVSSTISNYDVLIQLFQLITFIHDELMLKDFSGTEIEQLTCYECGDVFEANEEKCNNCGSPRPRCVVCLLDIRPSEKKKAMVLPCCGVFAHRDHLISWLETNPKCPNCKKDLFLLLRKLKKEQ